MYYSNQILPFLPKDSVFLLKLLLKISRIWCS